MQASPIGMASASQADFGGFDSRRLLQKNEPVRALFFGADYAIRETRGGKSAESTADKTVDIHCFPCASAQGASPDWVTKLELSEHHYYRTVGSGSFLLTKT